MINAAERNETTGRMLQGKRCSVRERKEEQYEKKMDVRGAGVCVAGGAGRYMACKKSYGGRDV